MGELNLKDIGAFVAICMVVGGLIGGWLGKLLSFREEMITMRLQIKQLQDDRVTDRREIERLKDEIDELKT